MLVVYVTKASSVVTGQSVRLLEILLKVVASVRREHIVLVVHHCQSSAHQERFVRSLVCPYPMETVLLVFIARGVPTLVIQLMELLATVVLWALIVPPEAKTTLLVLQAHILTHLKTLTKVSVRIAQPENIARTGEIRFLLMTAMKDSSVHLGRLFHDQTITYVLKVITV